MKVIEDMEQAEVIFGEVIFEVDIIIEWIEVGKVGKHGDNLDQEKEEVGQHLVLDWDQEPVHIEIGSGVSNVESVLF